MHMHRACKIGLMLVCLGQSQLSLATLLPESIGIGLGYAKDAHENIALEASWFEQADWQVRGRLEHGLYSRTHQIGWVEFAESFERNSLGLFVDRKLAEGLYLSSGLLHFDQASHWVASPRADAVYKLNGRYYAGIQLGKPQADIDYQPIVPYLGIHWAVSLPDPKWSINAEVGVLFGLDPSLTMYSDNPANLPLLNTDLQFEADKYVARLKSNGEFLERTAPRASITATYHF